MARFPRCSLPKPCILLMAACGAAAAQDLGTMDPKPLPPLENPDDPKTPAKELFGRKTAPASMAARSIGYYTHGCLAGGVALPINGPTWQVMRLSRNRNWGHPRLIKVLERLAKKAPSIGWPGFLVGDMAQPRGGPMITGHWSHQVGLDADVWLTPMPDRELTRQEREEMSATNIVNDKWNDVRPDVWSEKYVALYKMLAQDPRVERVLANPAIKRALCRDVKGDRSWLHKIRPVVGHNYHFHVRIGCPQGQRRVQGAAGAADRRRLRQGPRLVVHQAAGGAEADRRAKADSDVGAAASLQANI